MHRQERPGRQPFLQRQHIDRDDEKPQHRGETRKPAGPPVAPLLAQRRQVGGLEVVELLLQGGRGQDRPDRRRGWHSLEIDVDGLAQVRRLTAEPKHPSQSPFQEQEQR
jgi:hypothetical protein